MKFGIHIGHMGGPLDEMRKLWKFADAKGFDWFSVSDHFQESPPRGGDMDWVSFKVPVEEGKTQNLPLPLAREIATLAVGAASTAAVEGGSQRYLVKVDAARPTQVPGYDAVRPAIRQALETAELERVTVQVVGGLLKAAKIVQ